MTMVFSTARMGKTKKNLKQISRRLQLLMALVNFPYKIETMSKYSPSDVRP